MKKLLSTLIIVALIMTIMPSVSLADDIDDFRLSFSGTTFTLRHGTHTITGNPDRIYRDIRIECIGVVNLTIKDLNIDNSSWGGCALSFTGGTEAQPNVLLLEGTSTLRSNANEPGIKVESGTFLTIDDSPSDGEDGHLAVYGGVRAAGIGSGNYGYAVNAGTINIAGGIIDIAKGGTSGAGIGGGCYSAYDTINISGGTIIEAQGGSDAAGIGSGKFDNPGFSFGTINMSGGTIVKAQGGTNAAGIGGGYNSDSGTITIEGGTIELAQGGSDAAGIGSGACWNVGTHTIESGSIAIEGGTITKAQGGDNGAGIGGGRDGNGGTIEISGGTIKEAQGGNDAAGIGSGKFTNTGGSGYTRLSGGDINISGGIIEKALGGEKDDILGGGAGIGGGHKGNGKVTISGGTIELAQGGEYGAGIGGGCDGGGGMFTMSDGTITKVLGGECGAGIGGGLRGDGGTITIEGGTIELAQGDDAAGIGYGYNGTGSSTITISGGTIDEVIGGSGSAAIGGSRSSDSATINITNGTINKAMGGNYGAGIGSGREGSSCPINISGGTIKLAQGGVRFSFSGAGIGGGYLVDSGNINISGGTIIEALGEKGSAGIGSGSGGDVDNITISDGIIGLAKGGYGAAGIGGNGGVITISGGLIKLAQGGNNGAGIGTSAHFNGSGGIMTFSGGEVYARGEGVAQDIGLGGNYTTGGSLDILGTAIVFIYSDNNIMAPTTSTHTYVNSQPITTNSAYGCTNFPDTWNGGIGYGYIVADTVSFDSHGGSAVASQPVIHEGNATKPENPSRTGYNFGNWYKEDGYNNLWNFNTDTVTSDITLHAKWSVNDYDVVFNANSGLGTMGNQTITFDTSENLNTNTFTRTGYSFDGWNTQDDGNGDSYAKGASFTMDVEGDTLYAQWTADDYDVVFNANSGSGTMANQTISFDTSENLNANTFTRTGYTFVGWNTQDDGNGDSYTDGASFTMEVEGDTLYAQWTPITVTSINFENDRETWNIGVMDSLDYDITPDDALNQSVTWVSDNPTVASVDVGGMITANTVGITHITVTSDDTTNGTITDTMTLQVIDSTPENPNTHRGNIVGNLVDSSGNPLAGYNVTLYSNPINCITCADGSFAFSNVPYDHHTLVVSDSGNNETSRFLLNFAQGSSNTQLIDHDNNVADITFINRTHTVNIVVQINTAFDDMVIKDIVFEVVPEIVPNPETGYY